MSSAIGRVAKAGCGPAARAVAIVAIAGIAGQPARATTDAPPEASVAFVGTRATTRYPLFDPGPEPGDAHPGPALRFQSRHGLDRGRPMELAQFQLPPARTDGAPAPAAMPSRLVYQFAYSSETTSIYRRNRDLDDRVRDNSHVIAPNVNGIVIWRPTDWLDLALEMIAEREIPIHEEAQVTRPDGSVDVAPRRRLSILVDQAFGTVRTSPFEFTAGRRNYEDDRRWLYDTSMDIASVMYRARRFRIEAFAGREVFRSLEIAPRIRETPDRTNTYVVYADWRGLEDHRLAAYTVYRNDLSQRESIGRPRLYGVRAQGRPHPDVNYWAEGAILRGHDETGRHFSGRGYDLGVTWRLQGLPYAPSITLGYAFGSGSSGAEARVNTEFRQTGIHSNEWKFGGIPQFKVYGEALDPDLSNLHVMTIGAGFYPAPRVSVDLVYHRYWLEHLADSIRNAQVTGLMSQVDTHLSRDVGNAFDVVVGVRNLFGIRRLGLDIRAGVFYPGNAYRQNFGTDDAPNLQSPRKAIALITKLWF